MSNKTVRQLAEVVKIPLERLLEQLKEAGLSASAADDVINEDEKMQLLAHLRKRHGKDEGAAEGTLKRVTLKRRTVSELKQASAPGTSTKTISVEVRKQKTYVKREVADSDKQRNLELAKAALNEQIAQQAETLPVIEEQVSAPAVILEQDVPGVVAVVEAEPAIPVETPAPAFAVAAEIEDIPVKEEPKVDLEAQAKIKASAETRKKQQEKDLRLEESIKKNADKVRQQASAKQEVLHRKKQEESTRAGAGREAKRPKKKGKKAERVTVKNDGKHQFEMPVEPVIKEVTIPEMIIVSDLAQKMSVKAAMVIKQLMKLGIMATINQSIDQETAVILVEEMGHKAIMQSDDDLEQEMLAEAQEEDTRIALP
ncbi:MAG: translation initiation factor IF-2 N-terminal domain-containing protein, partial [Methylococcaceae bacterium]